MAKGAIAEGAEVVVGSSQAGNVETATRALGNRASGHALNVKEEDTVAAFFAATGPFDHLVFTAGDWGGRGPRIMTETDFAKAAELYAVRHWGALAAIKFGLPQMPGTAARSTLTNGMVAHRPRKGGAALHRHGRRHRAPDPRPGARSGADPGQLPSVRARSAPTSGTRSRPRAREEQLRRMPPTACRSRASASPHEAAEAYLYLMNGRLHDRPGAAGRRRRLGGLSKPAT